MHKLLIVVLLCLSVYTKVSANLIKVDSAGTADFTSIQQAINIATAGDTVFIMPGSYYETIQVLNSGVENNPIVIQGSSVGESIIIAQYYENKQGFEYGIVIQSQSNIEIQNLTIKKAIYSGIVVYGECSNISFKNLNVTDNKHPEGFYTYGIAFDGSSGIILGVEITNCQVNWNSGHGIFLRNSVHKVLIDSCHVHNNGTFNDAHTDNIALDVHPWDQAFADIGVRDVEIRNCEINNAMRQGIWVWGVRNIWIHHNYLHKNGRTAIQIEDGTENFIVEHNYAINNQQTGSTETGIWIDDVKYGVVKHNKLEDNQVGIKISKSDHVIVRHNLIYKNNQDNPHHSENAGITVLAYDEIDNTNTTVIHNTFSEIGNPSNEIKNSMLVFFEWDSESGSIKNCQFYNNIFSNLVNGYFIESWNSKQEYPTFISDNNLIYDDEPLKNLIQDELRPWEEYMNERTNETHTIFENPNFIDAQNADYNLSDTSPCIDKAIFLTQTTNEGTGTEIEVTNALFFNDGYGVSNGDTIIIGNNNPVMVINVDYATNKLSVSQQINWNVGDNVSFSYKGLAPDIGALEFDYKTGNKHKLATNTSIGIFPNPATHVIRIKGIEAGEVKVEIYNTNGKLVQSDKLFSNSSNIDISELKKGIYLVKLAGQNIHKTKKLIKY